MLRVFPVNIVELCSSITSVLLDKVAPRLQRNPLVLALPLQAVLLLSNLDLLDPWGDESFQLTHVPEPLNQIVFADPMNPPLYNMLLHYWIQLPWMLSPLASMRAMSALWAMVATVIIYVLCLRGEKSRFQVMFLALWVFSPCLLLHARMARSYSMELALACLVICTAPQLTEQLRINWKRLLTHVSSSAALLYTHYLSGLAVAAAVCAAFLLKKRFILAATQATLVAILFVPWVPTFGSSLGNWFHTPYPYEGGNVISDQIVRLAYLFV